MPAVTPVKFHCLTLDLGNALHNFSSHTLRLLLSLSAPSLSNTVRSNITEIAAGGGYTAGGLNLVIASWSQTNGVARLFINDHTFTATGNVADFRYATCYNDTSATDPLLFYMDYGSTISGMTTNEQIVFDFDGTNGGIVL
jgi:hypothetical protein